jgi:hypothetical protein
MTPAQPADLTDGPVHDYLVLFPSGTRRAVRGIFAMIQHHGETVPAVQAGGSWIALDPRAVIVRGGLVISEPSQRPVAPWVRDWLAASRVAARRH